LKPTIWKRETYWLGSDRMGRDMLSRLLFGTRISLSIGFLAVLISMLLGMSLGSLAGFFGGKSGYDHSLVHVGGLVYSGYHSCHCY
jgi:ABC-type dipeptide/oligopeptide/nickel transport system permease subunit